MPSSVKKNISIFVFCIIGVLFFTCKKDKVIAPADLGYSYYPSNIGHWVLYDVDSTYYDNFYHTEKHYHFQIKELIESTFSDNQNRPTQRIERYEKNDTISFYLKNVWASNLTSSTAEKVEGNIRYVKLVFPIVEGQTWNGNAYNSLGFQNYEYNNTFTPYTVNGVTYDSTVTVIQNVDSNLIYVNNMFEVYAKNIGMIYKRYDTIQKFMPPNIYPDSIIAGVKCTYKIISFGN